MKHNLKTAAEYAVLFAVVGWFASLATVCVCLAFAAVVALIVGVGLAVVKFWLPLLVVAAIVAVAYATRKGWTLSLAKWAGIVALACGLALVAGIAAALAVLYVILFDSEFRRDFFAACKDARKRAKLAAPVVIENVRPVQIETPLCVPTAESEAFAAMFETPAIEIAAPVIDAPAFFAFNAEVVASLPCPGETPASLPPVAVVIEQHDETPVPTLPIIETPAVETLGEGETNDADGLHVQKVRQGADKVRKDYKPAAAADLIDGARLWKKCGRKWEPVTFRTASK